MGLLERAIVEKSQSARAHRGLLSRVMEMGSGQSGADVKKKTLSRNA
jgi:hypothetical protein